MYIINNSKLFSNFYRTAIHSEQAHCVLITQCLMTAKLQACAVASSCLQMTHTASSFLYYCNIYYKLSDWNGRINIISGGKAAGVIGFFFFGGCEEIRIATLDMLGKVYETSWWSVQ